ncbi:MAG: hypothetical protein ABIS07_12315 [Dokdonella sp.]
MNAFNVNIRADASINAGYLKKAVTAAVCVACFAATGAAQAGPIVIPNGDFSISTNAGTIGGGVIGGVAVDLGIGSSGGPWTGSFHGAIGLLVPPTLTIDAAAHTATIDGLLGVNVGGIATNGGYFSQTTGAPYLPNKRYTVSANVDTGGPLSAVALGSANVGISLRSGATVLSSSATAPAALVDLSLLSSTNYRLKLIYDTGASVSGNVDVQLFDLPQGLLTANLLGSVSFGGVSLNVGAITDSNTQLAVSGLSSQGAEVDTPFGAPLVAKVTDQGNNPMEGVIVTVSAPASGASAILTSGNMSGTSVEAVTDANGEITLSAAANSIAGCYAVTASVDGTTSKAVFHLRNWSNQQMMRFLDSGSNMQQVLQDSIFCYGFE